MKNAIIDLHCDTILLAMNDRKNLKNWQGHINIEKLKKGGCLAQCFALFIPQNAELAEYHFADESPWGIYHTMLASYKDNLNLCSECLRPAYSAEDVMNNFRDGYISSILTVEDGMLLDGKIDRTDELYRDGVRMLALTWNYENTIGFPNSPDQKLHTTRGLKDFGFEVIERMNTLGMIIDVSHLSEAGFMDVVRCSRKPFAASHSCCRSICGHQRNLTDKQLKMIGDCGGIVGVNFYSKFLADDSDDTLVESIVRHAEHIRNKAGIDCVSWGSDFDGFDSRIEFDDYSGFPMLLDALSRKFTDDEIDKINSGNFLRVFREVQKQ